jgi:hypothetical protein
LDTVTERKEQRGDAGRTFPEVCSTSVAGSVRKAKETSADSEPLSSAPVRAEESLGA